MNTDYSNLSALIQSVVEKNEPNKGPLQEKQLICLGETAASNFDKLLLFFKKFFHHIVNGSEAATKYRDEFYIKKSVTLIRDFNLQKLSDKVADQQERMFYLTFLDRAEVLSDSSPHWASIEAWHQGYCMFQQARATLDGHWLKPFATADDLGEKLEPFPNREQLDHLLALDRLHKEFPSASFLPLLQTILGAGKLINISQEQINAFDARLRVGREQPKQAAEDKQAVFVGNLLYALDKQLKTEREKGLLREFVPLIIRHLNKLDFDYQSAPQNSKEKGKKEKEIKELQESVKKLIKFCCKEDERQVYAPHLMARAALNLLEQGKKPSQTPSQNLNHVADKCDSLLKRGTMGEHFQVICFQLYMEDVAKKICERQHIPYEGKISDLIAALASRFSHHDKGLDTPQAASYISDLVEFVVSLSLSTEAKTTTLMNVLLEESNDNDFSFDLKKINKKAKANDKPLKVPESVKANILKKLKDTSAKSTELSAIFRKIENNPFAVFSTFFPRLIQNLLPPEDKNKVEDIRRALVPLEPLFNQSLLVGKGVKALGNVFALIPNNADPEKAKVELVKQIEGFNKFDIEEMARLNDRHKYRRALKEKGLGLWMTAAELVSENLVDVHQQMQAASATTSAASAGKIGEKETEKNPLVDFMRNTLPKLVEDRKTITDWIKTLPVVIPIIRRVGGGWIANQILKRYVSAKLDKIDTIDPASKKLIAGSMETIIQTVLLASPVLLKKHNIETYLNFFERLNERMNKPELDDNALFLEVMKIIQNLTSELTAYGPVMDDALSHALT